MVTKEKTSKKVTFETKTLQKLLNTAMLGVSRNKFLAISGYIVVKLKDGLFSITATDLKNYIQVFEEKVVGEDFDFIITADRLNRIIQKLTSVDTVLTISDDYLGIKGNGNYKLAWEGAEIDTFKEYFEFPELGEVETTEIINLGTIKSIIATNKFAVGTVEDSVSKLLTGYYCGPQIVTSNEVILVKKDLTLFEKPFLAPAVMFTFLNAIDVNAVKDKKDDKEEDKTDSKAAIKKKSKDIIAKRRGDKILFETDDCNIFITELENADSFPYEDCIAVTATRFDSHCEVSKSSLLSLLDRLSLFVLKSDENIISMLFNKDKIIFRSNTGTGYEELLYSKPLERFREFSCRVDIVLLKEGIESQKDENITLYYGNDRAFKFHGGDALCLISLSADSTESVKYEEIELAEESYEETQEVSEDEIPF